MDLISNLRLALFGLGLLALYGGWQGWWPYGLLVAPIAGFIGLVFAHEHTARALERAQDAVAFYERGLQRLAGTWAGGEYADPKWFPEGHLYARDIDCFGEGGLFDLLCQARTYTGAETLARWLAGSAPPEEIVLRQGAARELAPKLDLREDIALVGGRVRTGVHPSVLQRWANESTRLSESLEQRITIGLFTIGILSLAASVVAMSPAPVALIWTLNAIWVGRTKKDSGKIYDTLSPIVRELRVLALLFDRLEQESFESERLRDLRDALASGDHRVSGEVAKLRRWAEWYDLQGNFLFLPFTILFVWPALMGVMVERWRARHGIALRNEWLPALGEIEALVSLSGLAYERPEYAWPEFCNEELLFEAEALGHPLMPQDACVHNDLRLDESVSLLVVSGSNMSGKSTLLRSIGLSVALAQAGGPVCARRLRLSPVALAAVIRVEDSVREGTSMFYAEIERFHALLNLADGDRPLLFLSDEILHGTNTNDRVEGSKALMRALVERGAIGLVTTHDLALTAFVEELGGRARNVHFQDDLLDGKLHFDYQLRDGVVKKSNALELMRSIGLPV